MTLASSIDHQHPDHLSELTELTELTELSTTPDPENEMLLTDDAASATPEVVLPCWSEDPELYFAESPADVERAKALCGPCPIREACLAGALERREPWGVWGGELVLSGIVVPRKRPRGRPRKDDPYRTPRPAAASADRATVAA